ncbi:MAG TPA: ABC transporter permease [Opitutus sp.]|nr:ABC transporter permease [Opitutus sp.]
MTLRLHFRNRMALLYGFLFPIIFLLSFWALYRHETVPLLLHMGELLTVTVLGGACFGLPTTLVGERERGVWQRYRLTPMKLGTLVFSTLLARYVLIAAAGLLQLGVAFIIGMTAPAEPFALALVFSLVAFAFIGIGLVIAALADTVPAVQALGQCVFLPMLILGGVAVPIGSLPGWAQHLSAFLPARYAVGSLQRTVDGEPFAPAYFDLLALAFIGAAALFAGTKLFRWASGQHFRSVPGKSWLIPAVAAWVLVGILAESRGRISVDTAHPASSEVAAESVPPVKTPPPLQPWEKLTDAEIDALDFRGPPDAGRVTPFARKSEMPDEETDFALAQLEGALPHWPPGQIADPVQRARNLLSVAAVVDLLQNPLERFVPPLVQQRLLADDPEDKLVRILAWIALHPDEGTVITDLSDLHLEGVVSETVVRERTRIYATKMIARISGRPTIRQ